MSAEQSMSMTITASYGNLSVFDLIQYDDVDELIVQLNNQPSLIHIRDEAAQTLLIVAAQCGSIKILRELLKRNNNANETDQDESTALIGAAKENHQECVNELLDSGADLMMKDKDGWGAITWAAYRGHFNVVQLLLAWKANPNETGQHGMNPVIWAAGRGHTRVVEELLNTGANPNSRDKHGTSALVWAARKGYVDVIKVLLDKKANVDQPGTNGWTPLIMATKGGFEEAATVLLDSGADVNFLDQDNNSALAWAVKQSHTGIVRKLVEKGAFVNIRNKEGLPMLTLASKDGHVDIVSILLEHYADVEAVDMVSKTALWYAVEKGHNEIVRELVECGASTNCQRKDGETPLLLAVKKKHLEIVSLLLEKNADLSISDKKGDTALHIAIRCRYRRIAEVILKDPKSARLLYQTNRAGETPYRIDQRHKKSVLKPILGMVEGDWQRTEELLGHDAYTTSLAELLCEPSLEVPLTVGVYARWGSNKVHFFKRLQEEMTEITQQSVRPKLRFTWFGVLSCLFLCSFLAVCFCSAFNWIVGASVGGAALLLCLVFYLVILLWENKWCDNTRPSWISEYYCRFSAYFHLLYLITFCIPPTLTCMRSSLPVHFTFADFSKLTRSSNEATALVSMIESLNEVIEGNYGCIATRLYRVLRPPLLDYVEVKHSQPQFKKCCCCLPKLCIFFFVVICGAMALVFYTVVGSDSSSVVAGLQISGACIVGIALVVHLTTFCSVIYSLLFSPKRRVSIVATQLGLKEEGFIHALKQEVELLTEIVVALDGFTKVQTRIILFLDGLDNSEQQKVLHLVDSINLLFTDPDAPFITVIAIDPRVTVQAIEQNFSNVLQDSHITALDYLKSIIHLPFFLPEPKTTCSGQFPDCITLSIEQLLRQRKYSGLELEWEGESFELTPGSTRHWKSNGVLPSNRHSAVLTVDQAEAGEGKFNARLTRSNMDIYYDKYEESPDLTHVLADNETLTPLGIQRLLHTTSLSGRLLRAKGFHFQWTGLASWVSLVDAWPYRVSWLVLIMEEFTTILPDNLPLKALYVATQAWLPDPGGFDYAVDNDPTYFEAFLGSHIPNLKVEDLRKFLVGTINLDPAIRKQISKGLQSTSSKTLSRHGSAGNAENGLGQSDPLDLSNLSEEDICVQLSQIYGIQPKAMPSYQTTIRENNISGRVLRECELSELRDIMAMNFGDWQLFKVWILRRRPHHTCNTGACSSWVQEHDDRVKSNSADPYVEMGNLSCVKSDSRKCQGEDVDGHFLKSGGLDAVNISSIPRIVLDPGSQRSLTSGSPCPDETRTGADDENVSDAELENHEEIRANGETHTAVEMSSVRELYSITPRADFTDSSDNEGNETENTCLLKDEPASVAKPAENDWKPSTSKSHCEESRPLLLRQGEVDQPSDTFVEMNMDIPQRDEADSMSKQPESEGPLPSVCTVEDDGDVESRRVIPIVLTISPTKTGNAHVSSIVATRNLSSAMARSPTSPSSPRLPKQKSPKSRRSPRSPRSLRGLFSCSGSSQRDGNADVETETEHPAEPEDTSPFDPRAFADSDENTRQSKQGEKDFATGIRGDGSNVRGEPSVTNNNASGQYDNLPEFSRVANSSANCAGSSSSNGPSGNVESTEEPSENVGSSTRQARTSRDNFTGCSTNNSFEETANNSDKGYESVDNSPNCVENDDGNYRPSNVNGSVRAGDIAGLSETANPVWVPLLPSQSFPRQHKQTTFSESDKKLFNQTMV